MRRNSQPDYSALEKSMAACFLLCALFAILAPVDGYCDEPPRSQTVKIFDNAPIHFNPEDPRGDRPETIEVLDNGRYINTAITLPEYDEPVRILAHVTVKPVPKDEISVHDKWDRAGSIRLVQDNQPDIEVVKFITAYGGRTDWSVDVSHLAPLLKGDCRFSAFIDTWISPAWHVDFSLEHIPDSSLAAIHWVKPLLMEDSFDRKTYLDTGLVVSAEVSGEHQRVLLYYLVSGHCTDGRGADEFVKKDNVISVDGTVVYRYQPWRDDCRRFRDINPYTRRWSDGYWSSDYSRSGWCPGDVVDPLVLDLTDHLTPGNHWMRFNIESIRPEDEDGNKGYWRVSAFLVGVTDRK